MKKLLFSLSLLASLALAAGESVVEATAQVYGVLTISSTAETLIVSVPWVAASNTETNSISVAEIIRTSNLSEGDWIRVWNQTAGRFDVWNLEGGQWVPGTVVTAEGSTGSGTSSDTCLKRGDALILHRQSVADPLVYVQGQHKALTTSDTTAVSLGTESSPAYTLIAPPKTASVDLNADLTWTGTIAKKDRLIYGQSATLGTEYRYVEGKWGYYASKDGATVFVDAPTVPAGIGFWYVSKGGSPIITWTK